jgi:hypothetical protein
MQELAVVLKVGQKAANSAPMVSDESKKFMTWDEYLTFVQALRAECAGVSGVAAAGVAAVAGLHAPFQTGKDCSGIASTPSICCEA